jgi:hypothetical protein
VADNTTIVNTDVDGDSIPDDAFETDFQEDITANYESPWSIGVGAGYHMERTEIHVSVEWFSEVDPYDVLEIKPFVSQATGLVVTPSLLDVRKSVFNVAVGFQQEFSEKYAGFFSFATDNSAFSAQSEIAVTPYDIYHVAGGMNAVLGKTQWMFGAGYAWGSELTQQLVDLDPDNGVSTTDPTTQVVHGRVHRGSLDPSRQETYDRQDHRALRDHRQTGCGRHGRGVPGP